MCCAWTIKDIAWKRKMKAEMMKLRGFSDDVRFPGSVALIYIRLSLFFFFFFFLNLWYSCLLFYLWENQQQSLCSVQKVTLRWIHGARVRQGYQSPCPSSHGTTWHMGVRVNHEHDARFLWLMTCSDWFVEGSEWAEQGTGLILTLWWKVREEINVLWR